jgi:hypothetical protein
MPNSDDGELLVVGLNGWGFLGVASGRTEIDNFGRGIVQRVLAWRVEARLPVIRGKYLPLEGGDGVHRKTLLQNMAIHAKNPAGGMILLGFSDGATTIRSVFQDGRAREALASVRITFSAFIDLVRADFDSGINMSPDAITDLRHQELIQSGKVYYQANGIWKGHSRVASFPSMSIARADHLSIMTSRQLGSDLVDQAVNAYQNAHGAPVTAIQPVS